MTVSALKSGTISRKLRASGIGVRYADESRMKEGVRTRQHGKDAVWVVADFDNEREATIAADVIMETLALAGYSIERGEYDSSMIVRHA